MPISTGSPGLSRAGVGLAAKESADSCQHAKNRQIVSVSIIDPDIVETT
jgi:hypothetical protein